MDPEKVAALAGALADMDDEDWGALPEVERRALVAEAFHTFDEAEARALADRLGVLFEACREDIVRAEHRLN